MLYECNTESVLLSRDVEILKSYISLEKIRYDKSLDLSYNINGNLEEYTIPPLLMIPLVENAFKHGISEALQEEAWINIDLRVNNDKLKFKVSNSKSLNKKEEDVKKHFGSIGLSNVRKRLDILYKDAYQLSIFDEEDMFVAILELDLNQKVKETTKSNITSFNTSVLIAKES
jgi:sensor histidine kinase YesM